MSEKLIFTAWGGGGSRPTILHRWYRKWGLKVARVRNGCTLLLGPHRTHPTAEADLAGFDFLTVVRRGCRYDAGRITAGHVVHVMST
jgi:hypothetical protein